jgi:hypothetical protein
MVGNFETRALSACLPPAPSRRLLHCRCWRLDDLSIALSCVWTRHVRGSLQSHRFFGWDSNV